MLLQASLWNRGGLGGFFFYGVLGGKPAVFDPFLLEPLPKEENAAVFLLWTPPFPFEYWVDLWPTDAKGTDLIDRVASSRPLAPVRQWVQKLERC